MEDATAMKIAAIGSVAGITVATVCIGKIDGAFATSMAAIIAGIAGYQVGKAQAVSKNGEESNPNS